VGKLLILELGAGGEPVAEIGVRFGMTGRLLIDGAGPIDHLEYSSKRNDPRWDRATFDFGSVVTIRDQRRLGSVEVDPDMSRLGLDVLSIEPDDWSCIVERRSKSIKAVMLDQSLMAGLGNLLCDEVLWRSGVAPDRSAKSLISAEVQTLSQTTSTVIAELYDRGGSHQGDSFPLRNQGAMCSLCGEPMNHSTGSGKMG